METRIQQLWHVLNRWLQPDNAWLQKAVSRTVNEGYFARHDVDFALDALRKRLSGQILRQWKSSANGLSIPDKGNRTVLCLHAGNLPMVGFQDVVVSVLGGYNYYGKISRKDPYLIPAFLDFACDFGIKNIKNWSLQLNGLMPEPADAVLFSGSEQTVPAVKNAIKTQGFEHTDTRYLIRTAHCSVAYITDTMPKTMKDLAEAMLRYGGKGCRSVAMVVSPIPLNEIKCHLTDYIESFWLKNPPEHRSAPELFYRYAYNKAVKKPQAWLDYFLIEQGTAIPRRPGLITWMKGDKEAVRTLWNAHAETLQNIYISRPDAKIPELEKRTDWLWNAQKPAINWQPDGIDPLKWLVGK